MDAAKASVQKFMSKDGKHDTSIHETVSPAVQHETVEARQHERATTAVDREVHQDHYHTSEQPVHHSETLPEQHHHNLRPVEHRSYEHDDANRVKQRLADEQSKYRDQSQRVEGENTSTVQPTVAGEHVHHHVHENIQPIIQKQTVEPHVVHTTVPIHEVHHNAAQHHSASALPAVSMEEFKKNGGSLGGREERQDRFDGCPPEHLAGHHPHKGLGLGRRGSGSSSSSSSSDEEKRSKRTAKNADGYGSNNSRNGVAGAGAPVAGAGAVGGAGYGATNGHQHPDPASYGNDMHTTSSKSSSASKKKPSLLDKLNPKVDSNGDGKAGFMK